jgi:hypothetical protein
VGQQLVTGWLRQSVEDAGKEVTKELCVRFTAIIIFKYDLLTISKEQNGDFRLLADVTFSRSLSEKLLASRCRTTKVGSQIARPFF